MTWSTPKTDWTSTDGVTNTDMNRIEGNIESLDSRTDTLETDTAAHAADTTIHQTNAQARVASASPLRLELATADTGHSSGDIWLRTDL
jgi:hypothetical protein